MGQAALVIVERTIDELISMAKHGIIDKVPVKDLEEFKTPGDKNYNNTLTTCDSGSFDMGDLNTIPVWLYFKKMDCRWYASFSLKGEKLVGDFQLVDDLFFGGRKVNKLPAVIGTTKFKLWEAVGRGLPEVIAPIEDEWTAHRNNINDAAKAALTGRYRVEPTSRIRINDLLNSPVFRASKGEYEKIETNTEDVINAFRASDSLNSDMTELTPVGMENKNIAPKGTNKTLGAVQLSLGQSNDKQAVMLLVRNQTFLKPILWLIAEQIFAYETDDTVLRIAAQAAGGKAPEAGGMVDLRQLDLQVNVIVNAGLGSVARTQKLQNAMQLFEWGKVNSIPQDPMKIYQMLSVLSGFQPDQFINKTPAQPQPPETDVSLSVNADFMTLPSELQQFVVQRMLQGAGGGTKMKSKVSMENDLKEKVHNNPAGRAPSATPQDMTGATNE
jgi:hypothetical protein